MSNGDTMVAELECGKYRIYQHPDGTQYALRHGERWMELTGCKFTYLLIQRIVDQEEVIADMRRLTRELDVALNGEEGAAPQASLCDIVSQVQKAKRDGQA